MSIGDINKHRMEACFGARTLLKKHIGIPGTSPMIGLDEIHLIAIQRMRVNDWLRSRMHWHLMTEDFFDQFLSVEIATVIAEKRDSENITPMRIEGDGTD